VLIRDQHVSARTRVYLAAEGALLSAHTCVCLAAGDALAAIKIVCIGSRSFLRILPSEKYCDSMGVLEIFKPPEGFCPNLYFLGVWKCLFRGFDFEICQIGVLIF